MRRHFILHRRQSVEIRLEVNQILIGHALIGGIREGGIEVLTAGSDAMFHGVYKVDGGPVANAGLLVGEMFGT